MNDAPPDPAPTLTPRRHRRRNLLLAIGVPLALLVALALAPLLYAPGSADIDTPPPTRPGLEVTQVVTATIDAPRDEFLAWFNAVPLADILPGSAAIPRVVGTEMVAGTWREPGAVRRVFLADGSDVLETIEREDMPDHFAYKIWNVNGAGQRLVAYIRGAFHFTPTDDGRTHVEWRYAAKPRTALAVPHVTLYTQTAILPFLQNGLETIKLKAEQAITE